MKLPIDVVPNKIPPVFQWRQTVDTLAGKMTVDNEGMVQASIEAALVELIEITKSLQAFKDWVHKYLDNHGGVPHHPPGSHGAAGCRIGDRMDWLMEQLRIARSEKVSTAIPQVSSVRGSKRS